MNWLKRRIENQSIGLVPILLFMALDNIFAYQLSFFVAIAFCVLSLGIYYSLRRERVYLYMLLPSAGTLVLFFLLMSVRLYPMLFIYSPLLIEVMLVCILAIVGICRKRVFHYVRDLRVPTSQKVKMRNMLSEFYFIVPIVRRVYIIHLFFVILYGALPRSVQSIVVEQFMFRTLPVILGLLIIVYEELRIVMLRKQLGQETWLPVLSEDGRVIGKIAGSVSKSVAKKFYHPVVRVMVVYRGMLYLGKRAADAYVSPGKWDTPFYNHIQFKQSIEDAARNVVASLGQITSAPRLLVRYRHETERVKHLVSLFAICLHDDQVKEMNIQRAKFWTAAQLEENIPSGIFSEYFTEEYTYLRNTVLLAECMRQEQSLTPA